MNKLTLKHLRGACPEAREMFARFFPDGAPINEESALWAIEANLDIFWLATLLPASARAEYERVMAFALIPLLIALEEKHSDG